MAILVMNLLNGEGDFDIILGSGHLYNTVFLGEIVSYINPQPAHAKRSGILIPEDREKVSQAKYGHVRV